MSKTLTLNLDEIIKELKKQEDEGLITRGSVALALIEDHTIGQLIDSVNLLEEIEDRIRNINQGYLPPNIEHVDEFYSGARWALVRLSEWIKGNA